MTQTQTHTPGPRKHSAAPWFVARESVGRYEVYSRGTDGSFSVATCTKEVDAALIASAPALLAALEDIEAQARIVSEDGDEADDKAPTWEDYYEALREIAETARHAIAAVRGEG